MDKALQLESRFSLPPNSLGYCGKKTAAYKFKQCIINGKCDGVKKEVTGFIVLYPYLKLLNKITKQPKFSKQTIEGYWLGNEILNKAKPKDYLLLLGYFQKQGVPGFFIKELKEKMPKKFIPSHLFQVLHVGVGRASGSVPFNLETVNDCMIRWGKVQSVTKNTATVDLNSLKTKNGRTYELTLAKTKVPFDRQLVLGLKKGDTVAVHWKMIIKILNDDEVKNIGFWTKEVLKLKFPA